MLEKFILDLTKEEAATIEAYMQPKLASAGTVLIEQGSNDRNLFFLISGEYEVYQKLEIAHSFHALKLAGLTGPILFGEANLLCNQERNATVLVRSDCKYLELPYEAFEEIRESHPRIALKLITYAGAVTAQRYSDIHNKLQTKMFAHAEDFQKGLLWMKKYMGDVQKCSAELAKKLFKI